MRREMDVSFLKIFLVKKLLLERFLSQERKDKRKVEFYTWRPPPFPGIVDRVLKNQSFCFQERDHEYHSHLRLLKERVHQLENELATTQKFAGMPVKLPYERGASYNGGQLSPPELLKQPPVRFLSPHTSRRTSTCRDKKPWRRIPCFSKRWNAHSENNKRTYYICSMRWHRFSLLKCSILLVLVSNIIFTPFLSHWPKMHYPVWSAVDNCIV